MSKIYIFQLWEAVTFPVAAFVALKYSGTLNVAYAYSIASIEYAYNYSAYTAAGISSSCYFTELYKGLQIVRFCFARS